MKKNIPLITFIVLVTALGVLYAHKKDQVRSDLAFVNSLEVLKSNYKLTLANIIQFDGKMIEGADINTFELLPAHKPVDFHFGTQHDLYAKDKDHCYYRGQIIPQCDPKTFKKVHGKGADTNHYTYDRERVFLRTEILPDANPKYFKRLTSSEGPSLYSRDHKHVYRHATKIEGADAESFKVIDAQYSRDKYGIFRNDLRNEDWDPETNTRIKGKAVPEGWTAYDHPQFRFHYPESLPLLEVRAVTFPPHSQSDEFYKVNGNSFQLTIDGDNSWAFVETEEGKYTQLYFHGGQTSTAIKAVLDTFEWKTQE